MTPPRSRYGHGFKMCGCRNCSLSKIRPPTHRWMPTRSRCWSACCSTTHRWSGRGASPVGVRLLRSWFVRTDVESACADTELRTSGVKFIAAQHDNHSSSKISKANPSWSGP